MRLFRKKENLFERIRGKIRGLRRRKVKPSEIIILVLFFISGFWIVKKITNKQAVSAYIGGPESASAGEIFKVNVVLVNESSKDKEIRVGGADLKTNEALEVLNVSCGEKMPLAARAETGGNTVFLTCFQQIGSKALVIGSKQEVVLGEVELRVKEGESGRASLDFVRLSVPQADSGEEMAKKTTGKEYLIK